MKQSDLFLESEGDAFYERNKDKPRLPDPVIEAMKICQLQPKTVLELGCGNGWRLVEIYKEWGCTCQGYDASTEAINNKVCEYVFSADIASALRTIRTSFYDLVIFGFCLYLVDREDLMLIAAHTDRVLADGGYIIVHDFITDQPHKRAYHHKDGVWSYKMVYPKLWIANPSYSVVDKGLQPDNQTAVTVLRKDVEAGWPVRA